MAKPRSSIKGQRPPSSIPAAPDARGHTLTDGCACAACAQERAERDAGGPARAENGESSHHSALTASSPSTTTAAEGQDLDHTAREGPSLSLSHAVGVGLPDSTPLAPRGLPLAAVLPVIPPDIDAELNQRERRIVLHMVNGANYAQALRLVPRVTDGAARSAERTDTIPPNVAAAVSACLRQIAAAAGISRAWIIEQTVALYARSARAEAVFDRRGRPTGEFRFDGATAAKCLTMLAEWCPELTPRKGNQDFSADQVGALLTAVAQRGRPGIEHLREQARGATDALQQPAHPLERDTSNAT